MKREPYMVDNVYYGKGIPIMVLDETASKRNHVAIEVPLALHYSIQNAETNISAGLMGRFWQPTNLIGDVLRSRTEIGFTVELAKRISSRWILGATFYNGFTNLTPGYLHNATPLKAKNKFIELNISFGFK